MQFFISTKFGIMLTFVRLCVIILLESEVFVEMFADERQKIIHGIIKKNGAVTISRLVSEFGVSTETARRDLLAMEKEGILRRVHGGAVAIGEIMHRMPLEERSHSFSREKIMLAKAAADLVEEGEIIGIDAGSTAVPFAEELAKRFSSLTVVTYSYDVFEVLSKCQGIKVILIGGDYNSNERYFGGPLALNALDTVYMKKAFIIPMAVSLENGISGFSQDFCTLSNKMMEHSDEVVILADSSKFEKRALYKRSETKSEYTYVTDGELSDEIKRLYYENGIKIIIGEKE